MPLKILFWNCNCAFRKKYNIVQQYDADVCIIAECENPELYDFSGFNYKYIWVGDNKSKGLAVFVKPKFSLQQLNWSGSHLQYYLPVKVNDQVIVAIWAKKPYIEGYYEWQKLNNNNINDACIIIGDFNSNSCWDHLHGKRNHTAVVEQLKCKGLVSAYHTLKKEQQGNENIKSFFLYRDLARGFYIDYAFCAEKRIVKFKVEDYKEFQQYSDHTPIVLEYAYCQGGVMKQLTGEEHIRDEHGKNVATVQDFWMWAYSNLTDNTQRGAYAEYLVSVALGADATARKDWGPYDVLTPDGIRVEVKASAYIQDWKQLRLSKIIFGIPQTHKYDFDADAFNYDAAEIIRQADVYVFCVETCKNPNELNERDLSQWNFYVISTAQINETLGLQKTVSLSTLLKIGARKVTFCELKAAVLEAYRLAKKNVSY